MKVGIVISQTDPETVWNAFRFANFSIGKNHQVRTFLIGKGVESVEIVHEEFKVIEEINKYVKRAVKYLPVALAWFHVIKKGPPFAQCLLCRI